MFDQIMDHLSNMSSLRAIMMRKIDAMNKKAHINCLRGSVKSTSTRL